MDQGAVWIAQQLYEMALLIGVKRGDRAGIAGALQGLGAAALRQARIPAARSLLEESLEIRRELGDQDGIAASLHGLGLAALVQQEWTAARALLLESLRVRVAPGGRAGAAECLDGRAAVAAASLQPDRAARLLGAAEAQREALGVSLSARERAGSIERVAALLAQAGDVAYAGQGRAGQGLLVAVRRQAAYHSQRWAAADGTLWVKVSPVAPGVAPVFVAACYIPPAGSPQLRRSSQEEHFARLAGRVTAAAAEGRRAGCP